MSSDKIGDRTQPPTERRRREARARGEVARSTDLVAALILLGATVSLWWLGPSLGTALAGLMREGLSAPNHSISSEQDAARIFSALAFRVATMSLPVLLVVVVFSVVANLVQTGFLWVPSRILPRFDRIDPSHAISRWFSWNSWVGLATTLIRLLVLSAVLIVFVRYRLGSAAPLATGDPPMLLNLGARLIGELGIQLSLSLVVLALLDYGFHFWRHERSLMMTVEEVRREQREDEGDPHLKRRRREIANGSSITGEQSLDGIRSV